MTTWDEVFSNEVRELIAQHQRHGSRITVSTEDVLRDTVRFEASAAKVGVVVRVDSPLLNKQLADYLRTTLPEKPS